MTTDPATAASAALRAVPAGDELDGRYAEDAWKAAEIGVSAARGAGAVSFTRIDPPWLRDGVKLWSRQRLATGIAFNTIRAGAQALKRFSGFLGDCHPPVQQPRDIDRALLERYLAWLAALPLADSTKVEDVGAQFIGADVTFGKRTSSMSSEPGTPPGLGPRS